MRSREGIQVVSLSLAVLLVTALAQAGVFLATHSVALLADTIHNFGDALTAIPLGAAFLLRSRVAERWSGYFIVIAIFISAAIAAAISVEHLIHPQPLTHLLAISLAGLIGFAGNEVASIIRLRGGKHLCSPALIVDGQHARIDGLVSLSVVVSAAFVAIGFKAADPLIGLAITIMILRITWQSSKAIRTGDRHSDHDH
jgi:divalent metal cation (Fe/Co/Zn/Cd) transporter